MDTTANLTLERAGQHAKVMDISEAGPSAVGIELSGGSSGGGNNTTGRPSAPSPAARHASRPAPSRGGPQPRVDEEELLDTMAEFANPVKKSAKPRRAGLQRLQRRRQQHYESDDSEEFESEEGSEGSEDGSEDSEDVGSEDEDEEDDDEGYDDDEGDDDGGGGGGGGGSRPSEGYRSIDEEKSDIMFKLQRLQRQGVKGLRQFTPYSDIRDMRAELGRIRNELELERSIKFQRKMLMALVSALEWGNSKFDPFSLELDGWSEQMHESVTTNSEYDGVFEELWAKYRGKMSTPPEIRLLMMVAGSAMMFHMTKAMVKSALPSMTPAMMHGMMSSVNPSAAAAAPFEQPHPSLQPQAQHARPEMRGPGVDVGALMGGGGGGLGGGLGGALGGLMGGGGGGLAGLLGGGVGLPPPMAPSARLTMPQSTRQAPPLPPRHGADLDSSSEAGSDNASDRLSDVVSDDLGSVPDDLSEGSGKRVRTGGGNGGGGKRRKTDASKKVITI